MDVTGAKLRPGDIAPTASRFAHKTTSWTHHWATALGARHWGARHVGARHLGARHLGGTAWGAPHLAPVGCRRSSRPYCSSTPSTLSSTPLVDSCSSSRLLVFVDSAPSPSSRITACSPAASRPGSRSSSPSLRCSPRCSPTTPARLACAVLFPVSPRRDSHPSATPSGPDTDLTVEWFPGRAMHGSHVEWFPGRG